MKPRAVELSERDRYLIVNVDLGGDAHKFAGGTYDRVHFSGMSYAVMEHCVKLGWLKKEDTQNSSPSVGQFLEFLKHNAGFNAHGYIISPERRDTRISIEGVHGRSGNRRPNLHQLENFTQLCRYADEFRLNPPYAWWD